MATLNFIKRKDVINIASLGNVIAYCAQEYKTKYENSRLISGINCMPETAMKEFIATKRRWNKQDGVQYYYAVQSRSGSNLYAEKNRLLLLPLQRKNRKSSAS